MKIFLQTCFFFLLLAVYANADTFEVLTVPYEQVFPKGYQQNRQNFQPSRPRHNNYNNYYNYPQYPHPRPPVSNDNWVCRNNAGDMLIISSDSFKFGNNQGTRNQQVPNIPNVPNVPNMPNIPPNQPNKPYIPNQPSYPEKQIPESTTKKNPFLPNTPATPINCNAYPQHPMCGEVIVLGPTTTLAPASTPNTNGEGLIDVK